MFNPQRSPTFQVHGDANVNSTDHDEYERRSRQVRRRSEDENATLSPVEIKDRWSSLRLAPRLMPMTLEPHRPSGNAMPLAMLRQIERVQFVYTTEHLGATYFIMNVHQRHIESRLATSTSLLSRIRRRGELDRKPDYYLGARFSEFASLRASVSELMCVNCRFTCEYCSMFDDYIRFRVKQPRWIIKVGTRIELRKSILESFINDFLHMTLRRVQADEKCEARAKVPFVMARFLRERFPASHNSEQRTEGGAAPTDEQVLTVTAPQ